MLLAWAIKQQDVLAIAGVVIFVVFTTFFQIKPEEDALSKFSESAISIRDEGWRWL